MRDAISGSGLGLALTSDMASCQLSLQVVDDVYNLKNLAISGPCPHYANLSEKREQSSRLLSCSPYTHRDIRIENSSTSSAPYLELIGSYQSGTGLADWIGEGDEKREKLWHRKFWLR